MSTPILILGESGAGKSTSIRTLDPNETFIINVVGKSLPFKGWRKSYRAEEEDDKKINIYQTDDYRKIISSIRKISNDRIDIKNLIIDDFQYVMANEFMDRASEKGYEKFTEIAKHTWEVVNAAIGSRRDLKIYFLSHSELDANNKTKMKTIGKMLDEKVNIAGLFTIVFDCIVKDDGYFFVTNSTQAYGSKSPIDMFDSLLVPNDLQYISNKIDAYFDDDCL